MKLSTRRNIATAVAVALAASLALYLAWRAAAPAELNYNEGWNAYHAARVVKGEALYGERFGWTPLNYPPLSFYLIGGLGRHGLDLIALGRAISLVSFALIGALLFAIVSLSGGSRAAGWLAVALAVLVFGVQARPDIYVGINDPQLLAHVFSLGALAEYLLGERSTRSLIVVATLLALGANIKHSTLAVGVALSLDLWLSSRRRGACFMAALAALAVVTLGLGRVFEGPAYLENILLMPRAYSLRLGLWKWLSFHSGLELPLLVSIWFAGRHARAHRVLVLYLAVGALEGVVLGGGAGVSINACFDGYLALVLLSALGAEEALFERIAGAAWLPAALALGFVFRAHSVGMLNPVRLLRELASVNEVFARNVAVLKTHPGPAVCESLMLCYRAGKPYLVDPFNSRGLAAEGKLETVPMVAALERGEIAIVQLNNPVEVLLPGVERFPDQFREALRASYAPAERTDSGVFYRPVRKPLPTISKASSPK